MVSVKRLQPQHPTRVKTKLSLLLISIVVVLLVVKITSSNVKTGNNKVVATPTTTRDASSFSTPVVPNELFLSSKYAHVMQQQPVTTPGTMRVFGPKPERNGEPNHSSEIVRFYSLEERQVYMQHYGDQCYSNKKNLFQKYMELPLVYQVELWKWCLFHLKHANVYMEADNVVLLQDLTDIISDKKLQLQRSVGLQISGQERIHGSFLKLSTDSSNTIPKYLIDKLMQTPVSTLKRDLFWMQRTLYRAVVVKHHSKDWLLYEASCLDGNDDQMLSQQHHDVQLQEPKSLSVKERMMQVLNPHALSSSRTSSSTMTTSRLPPTHGKATSCPIQGGYCCQVLDTNLGIPVLMLQHPGPQSFPLLAKHSKNYDSVVSLERTGLQSNDAALSFFDIALQNDCLDTTTTCHKCLKSTKAGTCKLCKEACPCYCNILCKIRPPPKPITMIYRVTPPVYKKDASRLIPRLIHQTWYEDVTVEKYPNMSRLIESWKRSGWEYHFYNDDMAGDFLSEHFPPHVREAYDAILPGAFKADLFRYCVLLIRGGVYADMDVLLESNLDEAIAPNVGFMTPMDEPGIKVGHRSCLWNGLLAVAPGHVFLAKTIEMVVNHVRNRFTSIDYDDMLCPDPALSVSHTVDTLFTCGPCILGAAINAVLDRHLQAEFEIGDVNLFESTDNKVHPDDPRLGIPGRTVILRQNKDDMGAHRFTLVEKSLIVAATDMPDYDDRPSHIKHYSDTHEKVGVYGLKNLYKNNHRANEEIQIIVEQPEV